MRHATSYTSSAQATVRAEPFSQMNEHNATFSSSRSEIALLLWMFLRNRRLQMGAAHFGIKLI
jgi:hypothetical protein